MEEVKRIEIDDNSLAEISRFLSESFPKNEKFTKEFVRWQYAQNPLGQMEGFNAWLDGKIISHFAGLPIEMMMWGKKYKGLLCINVATNIHHRGKRLFTKLAQETIDYATANNFDFMIAVPNANSTHGFLHHFGFYLVAPLNVKVGFGKKIFPTDQQANCYKSWSDSQWQWRLQSPTNSYTYDDQRKVVQSPISFFAKTISSATLTDSIKKQSSKEIFRPLNLFIGLGAQTSKGLYFNLPKFVKRPPFNLVFKDLKNQLPELKAEDIFLQLIDLDTI